MQIPLQVSFEGFEPTDALRAAIDREAERLEQHDRRIIGCRVAVIAPSDKHRHGTGFQVHLWITMPPHENIVVDRLPPGERRFEHAERAVEAAFAAARRQVDALKVELGPKGKR